MVNKSELAAIGEIVKAWGIRGEFKVIPLTENTKRFGEIHRVYFFRQENGEPKELSIENYRLFGEFVLLKFAGIDDLTAASSLGRGFIYIPRSERPKLPEGHYYYDEIEGLKVYTTGGQFLGTVTEVIATASNDVYCVKGDSGEILLPALENIVRTIDPAQGRMVVELPEVIDMH